jgi:hypothetical protein
LGESAEERRAEAERRQHAKEENDVSRRSKEDCRRSTSAVDESKGGSKEVCLENGW